ncbi:MAG: hypothetical protein QOH59_1988 [Gemmatimonadales bacterium]|jgi:hypothetical protein|nr:hypothetical protein [Gemmatimonadales bacterium]
MTEQPRNWDKELADIDKVIAKQPAASPAPPAGAGKPGSPQRRFVALTWFWTGLAVVLAVALPLWPNDKSCGLKLVFYLGLAVIALLMGVLGALASWSHRRGLAFTLSLLAILWAGVMATREILPRVGYAREELHWTCPEEPPAAAPTTAPTSPQ